MRRRTQLNRADLLECLRAYGEAYFEGMAAALGYERREPDKKTEPIQVPAARVEVIAPPPTITTGPAVTPKARFWRVVENRLLNPEEVVRNEPAWFQRAEPFQGEDELRAPADASPPPQPPLLPWSRLWPFLKIALGGWQTTRTLDLPRILARLARAQTLRYLPRRQRHGWAAESQLVVDYAEPLLPFWTDFNQLYRRLRRMRGTRGLRLVAFPDGDPGGRCWSHDGREWREDDRGPMPGTGAAVLVLSDLGCNDPGDVRRRQWRYLGARLRRTGCRPVALMPCPPRWWDSELTRLFYPACWDRAARLPRRLGVRRLAPASERAESDAGAERLLALLAPAIRIEPALLRAVRYLLPVREADVGSEAAVWNHPNVHATPLAFYYDHEAIPDYRRAFQNQDDNLRRHVAELIVAHHQHLSPAIGHEERGLLANLENACDVLAQRFMARIVRTLHDRNDAMADSAQAWVGRLTPRQHEAMWQDEALSAAWVLVNWTALREGEAVLPPGLDLGRISWLLGRDQTLKHYTLRQRGPALYLEADAPAVAASELDAPGSPVAELGTIASYVQLQHSETGDQFIQPLDQTIPLPASGRLQIITDYQKLTLDSIERPEWAEFIGRDEQGLFGAWRDGRRRVRWVNPGSYSLHNRSGERFGQLDITTGCWEQDDPESLAQPHEGFRQPDWAIKPYPLGLEDFIPDTETARRIIHIALTAGRCRLNAYEASQVLSAYEIPVVPTYFAADPEAATDVALEMGGQVALKILSPDIINKSDVGGVAFNLKNPLEVLVAATEMLKRVRDLAPEAVIDGFAVQPMRFRHGAYELMIGVRTGRRFGPVIFFGHGGTESEVIDDIAYALPPPNIQLARDLMSRTRVYHRINNNRGRPADLYSMALTLIKVSQMVIDLAEVIEMDINPIWIDVGGPLVLDANMLTQPRWRVGHI